MKNTRLLKLLQKLEKRHRKPFLAFLDSPFYNTHLPTAALGRHLVLEGTRIQAKNLSKQAVFEEVFPGKVYTETWFSNLLSQLLRLTIQFLGVIQQEETTSLRFYYQVTALLELDLPGYARKTAHEYQRNLFDNQNTGAEAALEAIFFHDSLDRLFVLEGIRREDAALEEKNRALDTYYLAKKLRIACDMWSRNAIINTRYEPTYLLFCKKISEEILNEENKIPSYLIYYFALIFLEDPSRSDAYQNFTELLQARREAWAKSERWVLYNYALNHCIRKINSGDPIYYQELHRLYLAMLDDGTLLEKGYLTQWDFKNIVTVGLRIRDFKWTETFIREYARNLHEEERQNALAYNMASLYLAQNKYREALGQLQQVEFTDPAYHLGSKIIQIKCYYEMEEEEALFALVEAFRKYINRTKTLGSYKKLANQSFLRFMKELFELRAKRKRIRPEVFRKDLSSLSKRLESYNPIANKDWLQEKYENLKVMV